eukprot:6200212-Pleurochrysis_carterae.AAC.2
MELLQSLATGVLVTPCQCRMPGTARGWWKAWRAHGAQHLAPAFAPVVTRKYMYRGRRYATAPTVVRRCSLRARGMRLDDALDGPRPCLATSIGSYCPLATNY